MYKTILIVAALASSLAGQTSLQKMIDSEHAFALLAGERGTKFAFLATMTDDAVVFVPEKVNARSNWTAKGESKGLLTWAPNFADISSDGSVGYTTGNWEFRPKGKNDDPTAFGDFITIWTKQAEDIYKWVIDFGVSHDKPGSFSSNWKTTAIPRDKVVARSGIDSAVNQFAEMAGKAGLASAYKYFAGDDIRTYRANKLPKLGKAPAIEEAGSQPGSLTISVNSSIVAAGDLGYLLAEYSRATTDGKAEKGYVLQVWKLYRGKWHLELDNYGPVSVK